MSGDISIITTTGALTTYNKDDDVLYLNEVNVYGKPGAKITCDVSLYGSIYTNGTYQPSPYSPVLTLNETTGLASIRFQVRFTPPKSASQTMQLTTVTVTAREYGVPENSASQSPSFDSAIRLCDVRYIDGYNLVYGAPADGYTPCTLIVFISDDLPKDGNQKICMIIDSDSEAIIIGADPGSGNQRKTYTITTSPIRFDIVSKVPGQNRATVVLLNSPSGGALVFGDDINPPITFSHLPQKV
ncbi:hypothetical protein [Brucella pseudogrignonensis]|uniref:Uncharacterized protein n=1 Tax=Brucella pseudogrignonensis TaxID=419475 RepID=A0ABU1MAU8_9HYPH|nr:hypothetical protein [Brucella pseudogrignonensis]MDR6433178.1 hypothetical protein [Brucella pseudogrignonensis]